jgi:type II secretory pathway pseudopilin PulG
MKSLIILALAGLLAPVALAKLPPPSDEAKAKAAEAAAKTAWNGKVDAYQLCRAQERVAASFFKSAKASGKEVRPPVETPPCAEPGPFVYTPVAAVPAAAPPAAAPAAAVAPAGKS